MAGNLYMFLIIGSFLTLAVVGSHRLVGGFWDIDPSREDVKKVADFAVMKHNERSNDLYLFKCFKIVSAQSQVVAGTNYKVVMNCGRTSCRKNHVSDYGAGDACNVNNSEVSQMYNCTFNVYKSLPPSEELSLTGTNCTFINQ